MNKLVEKILSGDIRTVAKVIRDIDDGVGDIRTILKDIYPYTGRAYVIGITGSPGVGKSTLVDKMISHLRDVGKTVGVLAVDPTSPFSGGAILGDRVRMQKHSLDEGVFIRSLATRGHFGGLTQSTRSAIDVLDAMGKDYILVETVGVGQDEVDVMKIVHTTIVVVIPGMGDDIQAIKAGILEVGDIFVVNKADREGADKTVQELQMMLEMNEDKFEKGLWRPPILKVEALFDKGVKELLDEVDRHAQYLKEHWEGLALRKQKEKVKEELKEMVKGKLIETVFQELIRSGDFEKSVEEIVEGKVDPYTASERLVLPRLRLNSQGNMGVN